MVTTFLVTIYYLNINLVILTCNVVMVTKFKFHYTVVIVKVVNITRQCSDVHYIVFTVLAQAKDTFDLLMYSKQQQLKATVMHPLSNLQTLFLKN